MLSGGKLLKWKRHLQLVQNAKEIKEDNESIINLNISYNPY